MGMGQTILTTAFLVLISVAIINVVKMVADKDVAYYEKKAVEQSAVLANSLLTEIATKKFDSTVDTSDYGYMSPGDFDYAMGASTTATNYVMPGRAPDSYTPFRSITNAYFDDVDDYDGYVRTATSGGLTGFRLWVDVYYVNAASVATGWRTYYKKVDVRVSNTTYMSDTIKFSRVIAY